MSNYAIGAILSASSPACYRAALVQRYSGLFLSLCVGALSACAPARVAAAPSHDQVVPANEPRTTVKLELDLPKTASCEEDFDLKLYANPDVDLIEWSGAARKCSGRQVTIRFLSRRTDAEKLIAQVKQLSTSVKVVK